MSKYISVTDPKYRRTKDENKWPREGPSLSCIPKEEKDANRRRDNRNKA